MDGSLDTTFGSGGEVVIATNSALVGLLAAHRCGRDPARRQDRGRDQHRDHHSGTTLTSCDMLVLRFNPNGSLDTSFGQNGQTDIHLSQGMAVATGVAVLASGQIVVAGTNTVSYIGPEFVAARLTSSGALDTTFGPNGQGYNYTTVTPSGNVADRVQSLGVDASGNILVGGNWATPRARSIGQVVRYTPNGLIDTSFANQGVLDLPASIGGSGASASSPTVRSSWASGEPGGVTRLNPNGTVDTSFGSNGYYTDPANRAGGLVMAIQPDDKILIREQQLGLRRDERHPWSNGCCPAVRSTLRSARGDE